MASRDKEPGGDSNTHGGVEDALVALIRSILSPGQQELLAAFDTIRDPKVRQSLIDIAYAAAAGNEGGMPRSDATQVSRQGDHSFDLLGEMSRRVRGELRRSIWKDKCNESGE